ncbi:MAG: Uma2 family endonuclease [Isosphaeraceae bacterium]
MATVTQPTSVSPRPGLDLYRMTVDEYERLAEAAILVDPRVELIDGYLVRKMTKNPPHVIAVEGTRDALLSLALPGWRVMVQDPVRIPEFDEPEPDVTLARGSRENYRRRHPGPGDIGLIVEVADSSLAIDRTEKLTAYARAGIPRYWIVNLVDGVIETYWNPLSTGQYQHSKVYHSGDHVPVVIDGQEVGRIAVSDILA